MKFERSFFKVGDKVKIKESNVDDINKLGSVKEITIVDNENFITIIDVFLIKEKENILVLSSNLYKIENNWSEEVL